MNHAAYGLIKHILQERGESLKFCVAERDAVMCVFYWVAESSFSPSDFSDLLSSFLP